MNALFNRLILDVRLVIDAMSHVKWEKGEPRRFNTIMDNARNTISMDTKVSMFVSLFVVLTSIGFVPVVYQYCHPHSSRSRLAYGTACGIQNTRDP